MYGHSVAQPEGPGTQPHYFMHQLSGFFMTGSKDAFLQGATAFKNARDWARESRNTAITHANSLAAACIEGDGEEEIEAESTPTLQSFGYSTLGEEENGKESATSDEEQDSFRHSQQNKPPGGPRDLLDANAANFSRRRSRRINGLL